MSKSLGTGRRPVDVGNSSARWLRSCSVPVSKAANGTGSWRVRFGSPADGERDSRRRDVQVLAERGLSVREIAEVTGLSRSTVGRLR